MTHADIKNLQSPHQASKQKPKRVKVSESSLVYKGNFFLISSELSCLMARVHRGETASAATEGPQRNYQPQGIISKQLAFCFANKTPC